MPGSRMRNFVDSISIEGLPYHRIEHSLLTLPDTRDNFVRATAEFFIQNWMISKLPKMLEVWDCWNTASLDDRQDYLHFLNHLLSGDIVLDDPKAGKTLPMATFSETMLRWLREYHSPLVVEPVVPISPEYGDIDLIEITGRRGDYASMKLTMWEVKSSDSQVHEHNTKIYKQLQNYPKRLYSRANSLAHLHKDDDDPEFQRFLRDLCRMVRNRESKVHYGVFITYDANVPQEKGIVPSLHKHPYSGSSEPCHHLDLFLVPDFKQLRMDVWRCLHLL